MMRETLVGLLIAAVTSSTFLTSLILPAAPAHAAAMCYPPGEGPDLKSVAAPGKSGGVKLDQAATFLAGVSELTGAYYDATRDQIVFIGREETSVPKFDKDDLAVAIKAIFFAEANPGVKIEYPAPEQFERGHRRYIDPQYMHVNYMPSKFGDQPNYDTWANENEQRVANTPYGIEDTALAKVLFEADLKLKHYFLGFVKGVGPEGEHGREERVGSNVSGYQPHYQRWAQKNPDLSKSRGAVRVWMSPQEILVDRDDATASFVFKKVTMGVTVRDVLLQNENNEDPKWREAAEEFAAHHTQNFEAFAAETPAYGQVARLAQIVGVVKWLKDNRIATDFQWARHYEPAFVDTPTTTNMLLVEIEDNGRGEVAQNEDHAGHEHLLIGGGQHFFEPLTYATNASGEAAGIKQAALAAQPQQADFHWDFTKDGRLYEAIAVSAKLFRDTGAYDTVVTDLALETVGDLPLAFTRRYLTQASERAYSSHTSLGRGWDALPARLTDLTPASPGPDCAAGQPYRLAFETQTGQYETFTYQCGSNHYQPDSTLTTTRLTVNSDGTYTAAAKSLTAYTFDFYREYGQAFRLREIADRNGNTIHYDYHENSANLAKISDDVGQAIALEYSGGRIVKATDHTGRSVSYTYDAGSRLIKATDVLGRATKYEYDSQNRLTSIIDPAGQRVLALQYNELNKVTSQTNALGRQVTLAYDEASRTVTASDSDGLTNKQIYNDQARLVEAIDALGKSVKYTYGASLSPETVTDKLGRVTSYQYDARGNITRVTLPDGAIIDIAYNPADLPAQINDGRYIPGRATNLTYDTRNNLTKQDIAGAATQIAFDQNGQVAQITDSLGQTTTYQHNNAGLPTGITDPLGNVIRYEYDALGRLTKQTDPSGAVISFTYDQTGRLLTAADASGTTRYAYDVLDRLTKITQPDGTTAQYSYNPVHQMTKVTDAKGNSTTYQYDTKGNLITRQTAAGSEYKTEFDALSRPVKQVTPLGQVSQAAYNAEGNLITSTDAKGQVTSQTFDALGRPTLLTFADQTKIERTYDSRGNLLSATDPAGAVSLTYDQFDRLTKSTDPFGNAVQYAYDLSGRRTSLTYPSGQTVNYSYDNNDQLTEVKDWNNQATSLTYYPNGLLKEKKLANGITTQYNYDLANRLSRLTYLNSIGQVLGQTNIERSLAGHITKLAESGPLFTQPISAPTPTPSPSSSPTPVPTQPDLVVTDVKLSVPNPTVDKSFTITATVKNQGGADTGASFRTAFYYDRETLPAPTDSYGDYDTVFSLKPGESDEADDNFVKYSTAGQHKIWVYVDQGLKISESNEGNNVFGPFIVTVNPQTTAFFGLIPIARAQAVQQFITTFAYDALGQLTKAVYPGNQTYDYAYDAIGNRVGNTYDADAKLLQVGNAIYTYDDNGALKEKKDGANTTYHAVNARQELSRVGKEAAPPETWEFVYVKQTDSAWGLDAGRNSAPAIGDLDQDGKLDLLIGESSGNVNHYEQTEARPDATFTLVTDKIAGIDIGSGSAPALADIDADNDLDLFVGTSTGVIYFYRNTGSAQQPTFTLESNKFNNIDVGDYAIPRLTDIDADDDLDLFIGAKDGTIKSYENFGTKQQTAFTLNNNQYAGD